MKRTGKRIISMLLCVLLASALSTTALAAEDGKVLKLAFTDSPTLVIGDMTIYHPSYAAMLAFKGAFEKSTGGEYSGELYPNGVLGDAASTMEQMLTGTITGSTPADGALSAFAPDIQVFTIPYLFDNPTIAYDVLDGDFGRQLFEKIAAETGFRVVASYDNGGYRNFTNSKREIRTAADMEGLNIRVQDSPVYLEMVEALGASATPVAFLRALTACGSRLLEPLVQVRLTAGEAHLGRVIGDILAMRGEFDSPVVTRDTFTLEAVLPVATSLDYPVPFRSLTSGKGSYSSRFAGYRECPPGCGEDTPRRGVDPLDRARWILHARSAM